MAGLPWVGSGGGKPDASKQFAPKPGTRYNPPAASPQAGAATEGAPPTDEWLEPFPPATRGGPNSGGQFFKQGPGPR